MSRRDSYEEPSVGAIVSDWYEEALALVDKFAEHHPRQSVFGLMRVVARRQHRIKVTSGRYANAWRVVINAATEAMHYVPVHEALVDLKLGLERELGERGYTLNVDPKLWR